MISLVKARKDIFQLFTDCLADVTLNNQSVPVFDCIPPSDVNQGVLYENRYLEQPTTTMTGETIYHLVQCTTTDSDRLGYNSLWQRAVNFLKMQRN